MDKLLTRPQFSQAVFERDKHKCVICGETQELDAHHILDRKLWIAPHEFGGYFLNNGATLCSVHHILAGQTILSCEEIRKAAGITKIVLPDHLYEDEEYTNWGDIILANGTRLQGERFHDEQVQTTLAKGNVLYLYTPYVKHPRSYHLPWSNPSKDDKIIRSLDFLKEGEIVATVKMDGSQTTAYKDYIHARSLEPMSGEDNSWAKQAWNQFRWDIPDGWRVCFENVFAKHSIHYHNLPKLKFPFCFVHSIWNDKNQCLSYDDTLEYTELLGLAMVPQLYRGPWDEKKIKSLYTPFLNGDECEGHVVRATRSFSYGQFPVAVAKFVREGHVAKDLDHWRHTQLIPNELETDF